MSTSGATGKLFNVEYVKLGFRMNYLEHERTLAMISDTKLTPVNTTPDCYRVLNMNHMVHCQNITISTSLDHDQAIK